MTRESEKYDVCSLSFVSSCMFCHSDFFCFETKFNDEAYVINNRACVVYYSVVGALPLSNYITKLS